MMKCVSIISHSLFVIVASFIFVTARVSYGQPTQQAKQPGDKSDSKVATGYPAMSEQTKLTAHDLTSYESLCKALNSRGVLDSGGSSIAGVRKENWLDGALSVEVTDKNDIFQIRWSTDYKPYFGGSVLGMRLNETLDEFQKRFPDWKKMNEITYEAKYDKDWSILVTTHFGSNVVDDIAINNNHYSLRWRPH